MTVYLCAQFIRDLIDHGAPGFAARALAKTVGAGAAAVGDGNDHRFDGIDDAWIRYISAGVTAYRAIYIRRDGNTYWYRAGSHHVENHVAVPSAEMLAAAMEVGAANHGLPAIEPSDGSPFLKSTEHRYLRRMIAERLLIPHKSVTIVTPRLSLDLYSSTGLIGRLIDRTSQCGGYMTVITQPPAPEERGMYRKISANVDLLVHEQVNARFISFDVDKDQLRAELSSTRSVCVLGSAEISERGIGRDGAEAEFEELSYEIPEVHMSGADEFVAKLLDNAITFENFLRR